jgi:SAM-dependent methyltransferase
MVIIMPTTEDVQSLFQDLYRRRHELDASDYFHYFTKSMAEGLWKDYEALLRRFPESLAGKDVLDFGCKFGHVIPQAIAMGARSAIGIDVIEEYVEAANRVLGRVFPTARFYRTDQCLIPLPSASVDCLLANEVISHINPMFLETFYAEACRVLRTGGYILISDGNNLANERCRDALTPLYRAWENGPAGTKTDRDVVGEPYIDTRRRLIRAQCPGLAADAVDYLTLNTSGLFGEQLRRVVADYVSNRGFVERPYREGIYPTCPIASGVVMERGFYPQQVELALKCYGVEARQILDSAWAGGSSRLGWKGKVKRLLAKGRESMRRSMTSVERRRGETAGFQILGVKRW